MDVGATFRRQFRAPCDRTFRRVFECVDIEMLERRSARGFGNTLKRGDEGTLRLAIDGKMLRGVWTSDNKAGSRCSPR